MKGRQKMLIAWHWLLLSDCTALETRRRAQNMHYFPSKYMVPTTWDDCTENGRAKYCKPELVNIIREWPEETRRLDVSQTCGVENVERYCARDARNSWSCQICDAQDPENTHNATFLNDQTDKDTCWYSGSVLDNKKQITTQEELLQASTRNVTIEMDFRHLYEINFIYIKFCGPMPDAMIIYKSVDIDAESKQWQPYQYYANDCRAKFNLEPDKALSRLNEDEPLCSEEPNTPLKYNLGTAISFNTLHKRPSAQNDELNPVLLNWQTAGAIKIELISPGSWPESSSAGNVTLIDAHQFAINDIKIGGNCQCNGHADKCVVENGRPVCQCKHGTEGDTCNKCMAFHHDRPWKRGTKTQPNECVKCNCNLHARKCKFDSKKYEKSKKSGGVCKRCKHNTTGDNCQYCVTGYTPDRTKKVTDRKYCKHSSCKEGVTGRECTRCAKGYKQSDDFDVPCVRKDRHKIGPPCRYPDDPKCPPKCPKKCPDKKSVNLGVSKFCKMGFVVKAEIKNRDHVGEYVIVTANVNRVYRPEKRHSRNRYHFDTREPSRPRSRQSLSSIAAPRETREKKTRTKTTRDKKTRHRTPKIKPGQVYIWVKRTEDRCNCPKLRARRTYLMMGNHKRIPSRRIDDAIDNGANIDRNAVHFGINKKTIALTWRDTFERQLKSLRNQARNECSSIAL